MIQSTNGESRPISQFRGFTVLLRFFLSVFGFRVQGLGLRI